MLSTILQAPRFLHLREYLLKAGRLHQVLNHGLFWLMYYLFVSIILCWGLYNIVDIYFYLRILSFLPISIMVVYLNLYFLMPIFLHKGKYFEYASLVMISVLIASLLAVFLRKLYLQAGYSIYLQVASFHYKVLLSESLNLLCLLGATTAIKASRDWIRLKHKQYEIDHKLLRTELNFLKTQIQPHFFFNTLNNLYALTLSKSDMAADVVLRLSSLMRYLLYECDYPKVALSKEIECLENFIELEKLRFGRRVKIVYSVSGPIYMIEVPPFIFLLFVENSFKHGVRSHLDCVTISISLCINDDFIEFKVKNPIAKLTTDLQGSGIGLKNVQRRLELLYGDRFYLDIARETEYFVHLKLPLR